MSLIELSCNEAHFSRLADEVCGALGAGEHATLELRGESSHFLRVNGGKVRQSGLVGCSEVSLQYVLEGEGGALREATSSFTLTGDVDVDIRAARAALAELRALAPRLAVSPYARLPGEAASSRSVTHGRLLSGEEAPEALLGPAEGLDIAGIYASGLIVRASASSRGLRHWFETTQASFDYSIYEPGGRAEKRLVAGTSWSQDGYERDVFSARARLPVLSRPARSVARGEHRVFLAPASLLELLSMLSWGCVGEASVRQGDSALRLVREGKQRFSKLFSLSEDFSRGDVPMFNEHGEVAAEVLPLIDRGELVSTLVSTRSSREYGVPSNFASTSEALRAPAIAGGDLEDEQVLARLGTGLYLSNLWYVNWSDQPGGRLTGMTRYACFWVEGGELVCPIEHMRFDDTIFRIFGSSLEAVGSSVDVMPDTLTYDFRSVSASAAPGLLLSAMTFVLLSRQGGHVGGVAAQST